MRLPFFIARRYLFARKSHNVINVISAISAIGMAIGTAALIIILSVYNGFDGLVRSSFDDLDPDVLVSPSKGKVFVAEGEAFDWLYTHPLVYNMSSVLTENVFVQYSGRQGIAKAKGVDAVFEEESAVREHLVAGEFTLHRGRIPCCVVAAGLASKLQVNPSFVTPLELYFPSRERSISLSNPTSSIESESLLPAGIFSINAETNGSLLIVPLETMRSLLDYENEVSGIEIRLVPGSSEKQQKAFIQELGEKLGDGFRVADRIRQNESLYKMMKYEKAAIFLILIFIIIIIAFNIFGSLTMLIIEKESDIDTLVSMGAKDRTVKDIFILEGWMISLLGLFAGLVVGIAVVLVQQHFGIIKMPGGFMVSSYPVILKATDVLLTAAGVALIGYLIALLPVSNLFARRR